MFLKFRYDSMISTNILNYSSLVATAVKTTFTKFVNFKKTAFKIIVKKFVSGNPFLGIILRNIYER